MEREQFTGIAAALPSPLDDVARFLYASGWRKREATSLEWADGDRATGVIRLRGARSKNGKPRTLPLVGAGAEVIERRWQARIYRDVGGETAISRYVFHRHAGRSVTSARHGRRRASPPAYPMW